MKIFFKKGSPPSKSPQENPQVKKLIKIWSCISKQTFLRIAPIRIRLYSLSKMQVLEKRGAMVLNTLQSIVHAEVAREMWYCKQQAQTVSSKF